MIFPISQVSDKANGICHAARYFIHSQCIHTAHGLLDQAEGSATISLDASDDDLTRENLVKKVMEVMYMDSATEQVRREVDLRTSIQSCQRQRDDQVSVFSNRFMDTVANYTNQTDSVSKITNRQLALLMIRNYRPSPDINNSLLFELISESGVPEAAKRTNVTLTDKYLKNINTMKRKGTPGDNATSHKILNTIGNAAK